MSVAVVTTFPSWAWDVYARDMLQSFVTNFPADIPILVQLDDDLLGPQVDKILRPQDGMAVGWNKDHADFVARNKHKDDPQNYRKQATRFCHKVFAIHRAYEAGQKQKELGGNAFHYLIWLDADVHITRPVAYREIMECMPKEGDAVAYLGRKDWPHSECGWLAFDLENGGDIVIEMMLNHYITDSLFEMEEWHDSWVFDRTESDRPRTNLTLGKPGTEIWEHSPMAAWSKHHKGPIAKQKLQAPMTQQRLQIQTKNAVPDELIRSHIEENQRLIKNWIEQCEETDEEIIVVSAGPQLIAEDIPQGKRIVAVKHAIHPLKNAGIKPWACILLDPRPHVVDFVKEPDNTVLWFVASQVDPAVTTKLLAFGCEVWGYHASVGAGEHDLTSKQPSAVISGGSATATRGLYLLHRLGFRNLSLYGYELSFPDKPDLRLTDDKGQPKYLEVSIDINQPHFAVKKCFWTEPQLVAQYEEFNHIIQSGHFNIKAFGEGIIPTLVNAYRVSNLRIDKLRSKMKVHASYESLLCRNKRTRFLSKLRVKLQQILRRMTLTGK